MKYAIIDTETSGLFDFRKPADADGQPRLAQLAIILANEDLTEIEEIDFYVKPDGWELDEEAAKVNGLTPEYLMEHGVPVVEVIDAYAKLIDDGIIIAAYGAQFDTKIMRAEMRRAGVDDRFEETRNFCLMRAHMGKVVKQSGKRGWPKLSDVCVHYGIANEDEHNAIGDARVCLEILRRLHAADEIPEAKVHYAKNRPETEQRGAA